MDDKQTTETRSLLELIRAHLTGSIDEYGPVAEELDEKCAALNSLVDILEAEFAPDANEDLREDVRLGRYLLAKRLLADLATSLALNVEDWEVPW